MTAPTAIRTNRDLEILICSYYRDAEMRGSNLLYRLLRVLRDPEAQVNLSRHLADETRHAWFWTRRIVELGATPVRIEDGYQVRMGQRCGVPRHAIELFALTLVAEERAMQRYQAHLARYGVPEPTRDVLRAASRDEVWHIDWVEKKLRSLAEEADDAERAHRALERFHGIDAEVVAEFEEAERSWEGLVLA